MTQPITSYSLRSFHDNETPVAGKRRWMIRPLKQCELSFKKGEENNNNNNTPFDEERFFRLAVPLMPLLGIDLTPIIDLEVIPATTKNTSNGALLLMDKMNLLKTSLSSSFVRIRSVRLSILATEDEVNTNMDNNNSQRTTKTTTNRRIRKKKQPIKKNQLSSLEEPTPTKVSKDKSVRQMGNEAINFAEKLEKWLDPHLSFEAIIQWEDTAVNDAEKMSSSRQRRLVSVDSRAVISATIPHIPFAVPIPSSFLVKQIGSNLLKKALNLAMNQFLRQLEIDFKRWAEVDDDNE